MYIFLFTYLKIDCLIDLYWLIVCKSLYKNILCGFNKEFIFDCLIYMYIFLFTYLMIACLIDLYCRKGLLATMAGHGVSFPDISLCPDWCKCFLVIRAAWLPSSYGLVIHMYSDIDIWLSDPYHGLMIHTMA